MNRALFPLLIAAMAAPMGRCMAGSIGWGTSVNDTLLDADGLPLTGDFSFEIGTFPSGFVPDATNTHEWKSQWKWIEPASLNVPLQYVTENSLLTASGPNLIWERDDAFDEDAPLSNPNIFIPGEQTFIWVFNTKDIHPDTQWTLVTGQGDDPDSDWTLSIGMGEPLALTREWRLSNADTTLFGGLHDVHGPGVYSQQPDSFTLQTARVVPIPEPSGATFLICILPALFSRRRP